MISKLQRWGGLGPLGLSSYKKYNYFNYKEINWTWIKMCSVQEKPSYWHEGSFACRNPTINNRSRWISNTFYYLCIAILKLILHRKMKIHQLSGNSKTQCTLDKKLIIVYLRQKPDNVRIIFRNYFTEKVHLLKQAGIIYFVGTQNSSNWVSNTASYFKI